MSDRIVSRPSSAAYRENWERAFGKRVRDEAELNADVFRWSTAAFVDEMLAQDLTRRNFRASFDRAFAPPVQESPAFTKSEQPTREDGFYWVKARSIGWTTGEWHSGDEYEDGSWSVLGLIDEPWTDEDLIAIGPRIEPPQEDK